MPEKNTHSTGSGNVKPAPVCSVNIENVPPSTTYHVDLLLRDIELVENILSYPEGGSRDGYIRTCLKIGSLALKQAEGQVDAAVVRNEGKRITDEMQNVLTSHRESTLGLMVQTLKDYFDPESGRVNERLNRLLQGGGELETAMKKLIGAEDSEFAQTLARHVGESSPILEMLDPESSSGVISKMAGVIEKSLADDSQKILAEFNLNNEDSALNRFAKQLFENNEKLKSGLESNIKSVVDEFSLDHDDSALSRLVKKVDNAQKQISAEFTLDSETSALAKLRRELLELQNSSAQENQRLLKEIHASVESLHARKQEASRSTTHGQEFETGLFNLVDQLSRSSGDVATATGNTTGVIRNCKVGDIVIELGPEHVAAGSRIVFEAKDDNSYTLQKALAESETARKNRDAQFAIFVFSSSTAPAGLATFKRYGDVIVTVWDIENADSDLYPEICLSMAKALCSRAGNEKGTSKADVDAMNDAIRDIEKQASGLDEISKWSETVKSSGDKIFDKARIMKEKILRQVGLLDGLRDDLKDL